MKTPGVHDHLCGPECDDGLTLSAEPASTDPDFLRIYGSIFDAGQQSGRDNAGKDEILDQVVDAALTGLLDEGAPEHVREKIFCNLQGFLAGWTEMMAVKPLNFLTRQQTARVLSLPRDIRRAWRSDYDRGIKKWNAAGGALLGRGPILPEVP